MKAISFDQSNDPNPSRLMESLRHLGYENRVAVADLVDNPIDADAKEIKIRVWTERGEFRILVADNGTGMDRDTLDQALKLGSETEKNPSSDLGRFGMGLCTAGLSLARSTKVITKQGDVYLTSIVDVDEIIKQNRFCKYLGDASSDDKAVFEEQFPGAPSGTVVWLEKCDGIKNRNTTQFANQLRKHLGRVHRYFLRAGISIFVNSEPVTIVDPVEIDDPKTEIFSDENYPITVTVDGQEKRENVRVRIALVTEDLASGERDIALGTRNQGFYILRNNREIQAAETLECFTKHNDFNRMRGEVFFTGDLDELVGIDFTKRSIVLDQSLRDQLQRHLMSQCSTIKRLESGRTRSKEVDEVAKLHQDAEKYIDQKSKLLIMPKTEIEKRGPRRNGDGSVEPGDGEKQRVNFKKVREATASRCRFEYHNLGPNGQIYEPELEGRTVVIRWNLEHPFYQRFVLDQRSDNRLVSAVDYLVYSMASAELHDINDDSRDLFNNFKAILSANLRTLLA